jgi:hypothetical protein
VARRYAPLASVLQFKASTVEEYRSGQVRLAGLLLNSHYNGGKRIFTASVDNARNRLTFATPNQNLGWKSFFFNRIGEFPEWPNGSDCKSAGVRLRRFESSTPHKKRFSI